MKVSDAGLQIIKEYEGFRSKPYLCPAQVATIGYGSTYYSNGTRVKLTDTPITEQQATQLLIEVLVTFEKGVDSFTRDDISQHQFDALVSFAYNLGLSNLKSSTLLKKVNNNPNDVSIRLEFNKWNKANSKVLAGLTRRRKDEADLYFS